jgi:hypothetical protein
MADKPRVRAPKQRATQRRVEDEAKKRRLYMVGGGTLVALLAIVGIVALLGLGGGDPSPAEVRADLTAAGCTLQAVKAQPGQHTLTADGTAKWNTEPPTNGPHFGFDQNQSLGTVIWGAYDEPLQLARVVHNLEHGGIYIFYGDDVRESVVQELRGFYDRHQTGTMFAPYPKLGDKIALGAWVAEGEEGMGYLAKCTKFDEDAFSAFFRGFQFKGPERFPRSALLPGES